MIDKQRKALGRGLEQLFSNEAIDINEFEKKIVEESRKDVTEVELSELRSNPFQPRQHFDEEALNELAASIKEFGVIEPIIIKKSIKGYEIVAGERRVKASKIAKLTTIPAVIKDFTDEEMMQIALLENVQREDLSAVEEAQAIKKIINALGLTQDEIAVKLGKSRSYITNMLGILRLPKAVQTMIIDKELSMGHAKILSKLSNEEIILVLSKRVIDEHMSVRTLEDIISTGSFEKKVIIKKSLKKDNKYKELELTLREKIGSMVKVNNRNITIPFENEKDLERILDILNISIESE